MMFPVFILLCVVTTHAFHTSRITKRELIKSLEPNNPSHPVFKEPIKRLAHTVKTQTADGYKAGYENTGSNYNKLLQIQNPGLSYSLHKKFNSPYATVHAAPSSYIPRRQQYPVFNAHPKPFLQTQPKVYNPDFNYRGHGHGYENRGHDYFQDGGRPDFNFETTGGESGPQPDPYHQQFVLRVPQTRNGHRVKLGFSPVHYRYNDDSYADIECNRFHCPL